jgi:hypothetical protein
MPDLRRRGRHVHVLVCDVLEEREKVDFLLVVAAHRRAFLLADDRDDRLVVHLRVVQSVQKMDRAGTRRRQTHADFACEFCVSARHESGELFVARLDELDAVLRAPERAHDAVDAVAGITVDALHAPFAETLKKKIAYRCHLYLREWNE